MDDTDANIVINILFQADHGCPYCVASLAKRFMDRYPDYSDFIHSKFMKTFENDSINDANEIWDNAL